MPNWRYKETINGDVATIKFVIEKTDTLIVGKVEDCDGDFVSYTVEENGFLTLNGELRESAGKTFQDCWLQAIALCNKHIMIDPKFVEQTNEKVAELKANGIGSKSETKYEKRPKVKKGGKRKDSREEREDREYQ